MGQSRTGSLENKITKVMQDRQEVTSAVGHMTKAAAERCSELAELQARSKALTKDVEKRDETIRLREMEKQDLQKQLDNLQSTLGYFQKKYKDTASELKAVQRERDDARSQAARTGASTDATQAARTVAPANATQVDDANYTVGQHVEVLRSSGAWTRGTIVLIEDGHVTVRTEGADKRIDPDNVKRMIRALQGGVPPGAQQPRQQHAQAGYHMHSAHQGHPPQGGVQQGTQQPWQQQYAQAGYHMHSAGHPPHHR